MKAKSLILNEKFMLSIVLFNVGVIFLQQSGLHYPLLDWADILCTLLFVVEMAVKHRQMGLRAYWHDGWNVLDGVVTLLSLPAIVSYFLPASGDYGAIIVFRALRVFKLFRMAHRFPNITAIWAGFRLAMRQSAAFLLGYLVIIIVVAMFNSALFASRAPEYFASPLDGIYSMFRLFTIEGWYEIPNAVASGMAPVWLHVVRTYFCLLLIGGGIIGMSLINSIFVDAMAADNNDDVKAQLSELEKKIDDIRRLLKED